MSKKYKVGFLALGLSAATVAAVRYYHSPNVAVFSPQGPVAAKERGLIFFALSLSLIVVIPVFVMLFGFAWRYRESNVKAKYSPKLEGGALAETIWWLIPGLLILVLSVVTWRSSHSLDPFRPLSSSKPPMTIQVVAMDWKWLFIYPQQNIATVNYVQFPSSTPIHFEITSDAPMNSFWIPQLGGQIYAMPGMLTQINLEADSNGSYRGSSANISGRGFAGMDFIAKATSEDSFNSWVKIVKTVPIKLGVAQYNRLAQPSENNSVTYFSSADESIYGNVISKYMTPGMAGYIQ